MAIRLVDAGTVSPLRSQTIYHGLAYADIADVLSMPTGTVMSRLHAARKRLRDILDESDRATTPETSTGRATHE